MGLVEAGLNGELGKPKCRSESAHRQKDRLLPHALTMNANKTVDERSSHLVHVRRPGIFDYASIFLQHSLLASNVQGVFLRKVDTCRVSTAIEQTESSQSIYVMIGRWGEMATHRCRSWTFNK